MSSCTPVLIHIHACIHRCCQPLTLIIHYILRPTLYIYTLTYIHVIHILYICLYTYSKPKTLLQRLTPTLPPNPTQTPPEDDGLPGWCEPLRTHPLTRNRVKALQTYQQANPTADIIQDIQTRYIWLPYIKLIRLKHILMNNTFLSILLVIAAYLLVVYGSRFNFLGALLKFGRAPPIPDKLTKGWR